MSEIQTIREFICDNFIVNDEDFTNDDSLMQKGILDSTGVIEMADFVEEKYGIQVTEDELSTSNFSSVTGLVEFINKKLAEMREKRVA